MISIRKIFFLLTASILLMLSVTFCSATPTVRYEEKQKKTEEKTDESRKESQTKFDESFDITPFKTEIKFPDKKSEVQKSETDIWYEYQVTENQIQKQKNIIGSANGFRVQVIATDNFDEANRIHEEIKSIKGANEVYSVFEPPFYKILIGDFKTTDEANSLKFKLNQLGYSEARVIKTTINIFQ